MGELILCSQELAAIPYYIDNASLNVYSMEELSYYIENNLYLLGEDFMDEELCSWIGEEMHMAEEAEHLRDILRRGGALSEFVGCILKQSGYCSPERTRQITGALKELENKSEYECGKLKADRYIENKRYLSAIAEYHRLLEHTEGQSGMLVGNVWHNLGRAYAGLFLFQEAADCFKNAYEHNRNRESLWECLYACRCMDDENAFQKLAAWGGMPQKELLWVDRELSGKRSTEDIGQFETRIDELFAVGNEEGLRQLVDDWKEAYRKNCRM